ncbi:MAG: hypothetical protein ACYTE8_04165 [Planctomycetota bacterium]
MINIKRQQKTKSQQQRGVVLMLTLLVLVVLSVIGYTLTVRVSSQRHQYQYLIDYQSARYACDAGTKYALVNLTKTNPTLIERVDVPDFSDLFALTDQEYKLLLDEWALEKILQQEELSKDKNNINNADMYLDDPLISDYVNIPDNNVPLASFDINDTNNFQIPGQSLQPKEAFIPGPYGQEWPLIQKPINFEIGSAKITIEIEDENAKFPLGWALLSDEDVQFESQASFQTFCEWMNIYDQDYLEIQNDLDEIAQIKSFQLQFKTITTEKQVTEQKEIKRGNRTIKVPKKTMKKVTIPVSVHTTSFAHIFNSSLVNLDVLARPTTLSDKRKESALKYMGLWGSNKVNINTAPRQVLEAAFTFGGDATQIAEEIIQLRRMAPIKDIEELRTELLQYSDSIEKCKPYISTTSDFFTIRVTATSGTATTTNVIAIRKEEENVKKIAVLSG